MGTEHETTGVLFCEGGDGGLRSVPWEGLASVDLFKDELSDAPPGIELFPKELSFSFKPEPLHTKLSRKRFKKWLMGLGWNRNNAEFWSRQIQKKGIPYKYMQLPFLIDSFSTICFLISQEKPSL